METVILLSGISGVSGAVGVVTGSVLAVRAWNVARLISSTPATPIADLDAGLHEVKGSFQGEGRLTSPLSQRPCLYWRLLLEQRRRNRWETVLDRKEAVPCWLDDGGGRVVLHPTEAQVVVSGRERGRSGIFGVPSAELDELLTRVGERPEGIGGPYLRFREEVLDAGDRLYAVGTVKPREGEGGGWDMRPEGDVYVISDRDETEVVRQQQRAVRRWGAVGVVSLAALAYAVVTLGPTL